MDIKHYEDRLAKRPLAQCGGCGYPLFCFIKSGDGQYAWCPNCNRDDGSGGAGMGTPTPRHGS